MDCIQNNVRYLTQLYLQPYLGHHTPTPIQGKHRDIWHHGTLIHLLDDRAIPIQGHHLRSLHAQRTSETTDSLDLCYAKYLRHPQNIPNSAQECHSHPTGSNLHLEYVVTKSIQNTLGHQHVANSWFIASSTGCGGANDPFPPCHIQADAYVLTPMALSNNIAEIH